LLECKEEHQRELTRSTLFQNAALPSNLPEVAGLSFDATYEPGLSDAQVGGDWYDAVRLLDGRVLLTIGDVAGSGVNAAVVMGVVRQIMRGKPGYRSFSSEAHHYEKYLVQPDVGLALDSEWSMNRGDVPGKTIGHTTAASVNDVSRYLARLVATHRLPQKLLAIHLFSPEMVSDAGAIAARSGLAITFHIDGFGARAAKRGHFRLLRRSPPFFNGFKLFFQQDTDMLSAADVMHLQPPPNLITYE